MDRLRVLVILLAGLLLGVPGQGSGQDPEHIFATAVQLQQAGDLEGAVREYQAYLALRPRRIEALSNLGAALAQLGRHQEAIEQYRKARALQPSNPQVRLNLALAYYKSAQMSRAAAELSNLVLLQPKNIQAVLLLADCYLAMEENKKVIELLTPLQSAHSDDRAFLYMLGTALIRDGQIDRGQVLVDRILRQGESAEAHLMIGTAQLAAKDILAARKELQRAAEMNSNLPYVHSFYGRALMEIDEPALAAEEFRKELALNPHEFHSNLNLGVLLKQDQRYEEALVYLKRAQMVRPTALNVRYHIGTVHAAAGNLLEAQREFEWLTKELPSFVDAHVALAKVYDRLKRREDATRERATVQKLNAERQASQATRRKRDQSTYRGERVLPPEPK